jgi:asparagine synthase (glutamine-hydrolysing)
MCGLSGFLLAPGVRGLEESRNIAKRMADRIAHRGPDAGATWEDPAAGIALGHRRLSIIDLSPAGAQPMVSADGRWVIAFNGEIYNFPDLRSELEGRGATFRGHSDTEVLLAAVSAWGVEAALRRSNGMFAFALWDRQERQLHLARDRAGEKPLYYGPAGGGWVFGSELKALRQFPGFSPPIDRDALALFVRHGYVPAPWSIYEGVRKVRPGTVVTLMQGREPAEQAYWSAAEAWERGARQPFRGSSDEAREQVDALLRDSVRIRMHSDVPLGAFLSGGIDSSTVVALMQAQSSRPVKTFTIGFREDGYDEARMAKEVARHLGTDHTELYLTGEDALGVIPRIPELYDEPFADSSQIPTFLVSRLARQHVTVTLSGDGGDELFGGYPRYLLAQYAWRAVSRIPFGLRRPMASLLGSIPAGPWDRLFAGMGPLLPVRVSRLGSAFRRRQMADLAACRTRQELYHELVSIWRSPAHVVSGAKEPATALVGPLPAGLTSQLSELTYLDLVSYLPDDILVKVDRASMGVSLEARVPILDHRLIEFAASLPDDLRVRDGKQKWILRHVLHGYVPAALVDRPKMGFGVPLDAWIRGPLRAWALDLLAPGAVAADGYLDAGTLAALLEAHLAGRDDAQAPLWNALVFQSWLRSERAQA